MVFYVIWVVRFTYNKAPHLYRNRKVVLLVILLSINMIVSPYDPMYPRLIKYLGYIGSFAFGYVLCENDISMKCNKMIMGSLVMLPLIFVGLFDHTAHKELFFPLSNTYSYLGLCCSIFIFTVYNEHKNIFLWSIGLIIAYIISASSLGIVTAVVLAVIIINRKNVKLVVPLCFMAILCVVVIMTIDIPVFLRIRDVANIATSLSLDDWTHLKDMNFYEASLQVDMQSDRVDNTSFLWRFAHWQYILEGFLDNWWYAIPFGLGDCYANRVCGNYCHNEYVKFLAENGVIVFSILFTWILAVNKKLKDTKANYFILSAFCYHLTENLIDTFVACVLLYFCIGYWIKRVELERNIRNKKQLLYD